MKIKKELNSYYIDTDLLLLFDPVHTKVTLKIDLKDKNSYLWQ